MGTALIILAAVTAAYEVISRSIPTSKPINIIGKILEILTVISNYLDNKKIK